MMYWKILSGKKLLDLKQILFMIENLEYLTMKNESPLYILVIALFIVAVCILVLPTTNNDISNPQTYGDETNKSNLILEYIVIDGMPCLIDDSYRMGALSCDWSKWNGTVDGNEVILP